MDPSCAAADTSYQREKKKLYFQLPHPTLTFSFTPEFSYEV
jgi:hypothetical protein